MGLRLVSVGGGGGHAEFAVGLIEKVFRFLGVAIHVELIGLLGIDDALVCLSREALRGSDVGVTAGIHSLSGALRDAEGRSE